MGYRIDLRILVVTRDFWPSLGGAEVMLRRLSAAWTSLGHSVTVLTSQTQRDWPRDETLDGFRVIRLPIWRTRWLGTAKHIREVRRWIETQAGDFDVVYTSMFKHTSFAAVTAVRGRRLPVFVRAEGAGPTGDMAWQRSALMGARIRRRCLQADGFVAPSAAIREELIAGGYPDSKVHFIPNGAPIPELAWQLGEAAEHRAALGLAQAPTVCYTGRLHSEKGIEDLIAATALVGGVNLLIVGDGPHRSRLNEIVHELGVANRVFFTGRVPDVEPYLRASELFVLPSYQEGLSVALLEALALGMPTIASDIPPNRGILPEESLPLFPVREPRKLADEIRGALSERTRNRAALETVRTLTASRFGINAVAQRHLELFGQRSILGFGREG